MGTALWSFQPFDFQDLGHDDTPPLLLIQVHISIFPRFTTVNATRSYLSINANIGSMPTSSHHLKHISSPIHTITPLLVLARWHPTSQTESTPAFYIPHLTSPVLTLNSHILITSLSSNDLDSGIALCKVHGVCICLHAACRSSATSGMFPNNVY